MADRIVGISLRCVVILGLTLGRSGAAERDGFTVQPGPAVVSEAERAVISEPPRGAEHAVILLEETDQDDAVGILSRTSYHLRAAIVSNEGRDLANVEIPLQSEEGSLKEWWGRTLLPDGRVLELPASALKEQKVVEVGRSDWLRYLKGALPGVEVGAVIDYGYVLRDTNARVLRRIPMQRRWPILDFKYRWTPRAGIRGWVGACTLSRVERLDADASQSKKAFVVVGRNLPPMVEEPYMPPDEQIRASALFYYTFFAKDVDDFWSAVGAAVERHAVLFSRPARAIREAIADTHAPKDASLDTKLRTAYGWLTSKVKNTHLRTAEEVEVLDENEKKRRDTPGAAAVLARMEGGPWDFDLLFLGMARALGAEAQLVLVADRRDREWNPSLLAVGQFDEALVAVRAPGDPPNRVTLVDPGSALPYGEIPWWLASTKGFLVTRGGWREVAIRPPDAVQSVSESRAELTFDLDTGAARVRWSRNGKGQVGLEEKRILRRLGAQERAKRLEELCGASASFEVVRAEAPELDQPAAGFQIDCEGELPDAAADASSRYQLRLEGPWIEPFPELSAARREHPLVFPFPRVDRATLVAAAPPGFVPEGAPAAVRIDGPFGSYELRSAATEDGYRVERSLTLPHQNLPPDRHPGLRRFFDQVRQADGLPLVFRRAGDAPP